MTRFVEAKLVDFKTIHVCIAGANKDTPYIFTLIVKSDLRYRIDGTIINKNDERVVYEFKLDHDLELGYDYHIAITNIGVYPLNVNAVATLPDFDNRFGELSKIFGEILPQVFNKKKLLVRNYNPNLKKGSHE